MQRQRFFPRLSAATLALGCAFHAPAPWAALPAPDDPTRGAGSTMLETLQNYGFDIVMLLALLVIASMFVGVCYHAYTKYSLIHQNKATWGEFGLSVAVGAALLVVGIWLLTKATGVL
jgi:integrating conjugative element membrane protein (TIGR03745 family)